jgi:RpiB/LacA/LacB family sugar-phosphate isomerase
VRIAICSDRSGVEFKETLKTRFRGEGHTVEDVCVSDLVPGSYHAAIDRLGAAIGRGQVERAVLICSGAIGASIAANKHPRVRAAFCHEPRSAGRGVQDDNMNLLVLEAQIVTHELAYMLADAFVNAAHARCDNTLGIPPRLLARVVEHIRNHLECPLLVSELAALAEMSESHFSKLFKRDTGLTPHQFILHGRISCSKELLQQGLRIVDVALEVGFQNQAHFTTVFGDVVGITPRQFQRSSGHSATAAYPTTGRDLDHQQRDRVLSSALGWEAFQ